MRVRVDHDKCTAHGVCEQVAPEVFEIQDDATLLVLEEYPGEELRRQVQQAAQGCPAEAITVEDDTSQ